MAAIREHYPDAICRISCYPPPTVPLGEPWSAPAPDAFNAWCGTRAPYSATVFDTYKPPFEADHVLHLDADVLPIGGFDELAGIHGIAGVQAHHGPCRVSDWLRLFTAYGLPTPRMDTEYSGYGAMFTDEVERFGPRYFNSGVLFAKSEWFEALYAPLCDAVRFLKAGLADLYWIDQLALALAVAAAGIPTIPLPLRWNFPNRENFDRWAPSELCQARFIHAMQTDVVDRDRDFASSEALDRLCARMDLTGSNEVLRRRVAEIRGAAGI